MCRNEAQLAIGVESSESTPIASRPLCATAPVVGWLLRCRGIDPEKLRLSDLIDDMVSASPLTHPCCVLQLVLVDGFVFCMCVIPEKDPRALTADDAMPELKPEEMKEPSTLEAAEAQLRAPLPLPPRR